MRRGLLIISILCIAFASIQAQSNVERLKFPENFNLETQVMIRNTNSIVQVCNIQPGATYTVMMFDEREPEKRICDYRYGQKEYGLGQYNMVVKAGEEDKCIDINVERFNCKFESSILVNIIMHCVDCKVAVPDGRDPGDPNCNDVLYRDNDDVEYLVKDVLLAKTCFDVVIESVTAPKKIGIGEFYNGTYALGMEDGIFLACAPTYELGGGGGANTATGSGGGLTPGGQWGQPTSGDLDLHQVTSYILGRPNNSVDATILEFDFIPTDEFVEFEYVFASEEYCDYVNVQYNDVFGLFLSGPGIRGDAYGQPSFQRDALNLAVLPDINGQIDYTEFIAINNVHWADVLYGNAGAVGTYYVSNNWIFDERTFQGGHNAGGACTPAELVSPPAAPGEIVFDGWTSVIKARFDDLIPCERYHIKFAVADAADHIFGSAIYLRGSSFSAGGAAAGLDLTFANGEKYVYESCGDNIATLIITREDNDQTADIFIPWGFEISGTANEGLDYITDLEEDLLVPPLAPPGELYRTFEILEDDIPEGIETIDIEIDDPCSCDPQFLQLEIIDVPEIILEPLNSDTACTATQNGKTAFVEGGFPSVDERESPRTDYTYLWTGPNNFSEDTRQILFDPPEAPGTYWYFLEVSDDCGNVVEDSFNVVITGFPFADLAGDVFVCTESPTADLVLDLTGGGPWNLVYAIDGVEQPPIMITDPDFVFEVGTLGEYTLVSVESGGCMGEISGTAMVSTVDILVSIEEQGTSCPDELDGELAATGTGGNGTLTYLWNDDDAQTTPTATGLAPGDYTVIVTDELGCQMEMTETVTAPDPVEASAALVNGTTCADPNSGVAEAGGIGGSGTYTYEWIDSGTNVVSDVQMPDDLAAGTYTVVVTDENGCTDDIEIEVTADLNTPAVDAAEADLLTCTEQIISLDGTGTSEGGDFTYLWTTADGNIVSGDDSLFPEVDMPGTYELLVTNTVNGCQNTTSVVVVQNVLNPTADAGIVAQLDCQTMMISLGGSGSSTGPEFTYLWTTADGNIVSGNNTANPEVNAGGTYLLTVTNTTNGCEGTQEITIPQDTESPAVVIADPGLLTCEDNSQMLDGSQSSSGANYTYTWTTSDGNILAGADGANPEINAAGSYTLTILNTSNNCSEDFTVTVEEDADRPLVDIITPIVIDCRNEQIVLDGSGSEDGATITYTWTASNGGNIISGADSETPTVNQGGTYTLTVSNSATGCDDFANVDVIMDMEDPIADAGIMQQIDCAIQSVSLGGPMMSSGPEFTYQWTAISGAAPMGSTTANPTVNGGGTYEVLVTNTINGCTAVQQVNIEEDTELPTISDPAIADLTCVDPILILDANGSSSGGDFTYSWTTADGNILSGSDGLSPEVDDPGTYTLLITNNTNNCTATESYIINEDAEFPNVSIVTPITLDCNNGDIQLDGSASDAGPDITYTWTTADGNVISGGATPIATINQAGTYILTVDNSATGCTETEMVEVIQDIENPIADVGIAAQIDCDVTSLTLGGIDISTGPEFTYEWTGPNNFTSNQSNPEITEGGSYNLVITNNTNGCIDENSIVITQSQLDPEISPVFPEVLTCEDPMQVLDASGSSTGPEFEYLWTTSDGNILSGSDGLTPEVDDPGTYTLLITNTSNNCFVEQDFVVEEDADFPEVSIVDPITLDCNNPSIEIDGSNSDSGADITYEWTTPDGNIVRNGDDLIVEIDEPGTYTLIVSNAASGCTENETVIVESNFSAPEVDPGASATLSCTEETVNLDGSGSSAGANFSYEWTTSAGNIVSGENSLNPVVDQAALYTLIVTDETNGCTNSAEVEVLADENLPTVVAEQPGTLNCFLQSTQIDASGSDQASNLSYNWETLDGNIVSGIDGLMPMVDQAGTYTLTIVNEDNGCDASLSITINQNIELPVADAGLTETLNCEVTSLNLDGDDSDLGDEFEYLWTTTDGNIVNGANTLAPMINEPGNYSLTVLNTENGCESISEVEIIEDITEPEVVIEMPALLTCSTTEIQVDGSSSQHGGNFTCVWTDENGNTVSDSPQFMTSDPGTYTLTVFNGDNQCSAFSSVLVEQNIEEPTALISQPNMLTCNEQEVALIGEGSSIGNEFEYVWTTLNGNIVNGANTIDPMVSEPGMYTLVVTNTINDCSATTMIEVLQDIEAPSSDAGTTIEITCAEPENLLDGSASSTGPEFSYEWVGSNGGFVLSGGNTTSPTINAAGTYTLIVTDETNGCSTFSEVQVTSNDVFPLAQISDPELLTCLISETTLSANTDVTNAVYTWTTIDGNILSGADSSNPLIDSPGTYIVEIEDLDNGCTSPASITVIQDIDLPEVEAGEPFVLNCTVDEVNLVATASNGNLFNYNWTTPDGNIVSGQDGLSPLVDAPGLYTLFVVNTMTGCESTDLVEVTLDEDVPTGFQAEVLPPMCFGDQGSIVDIIVDGGVGPFQYSIDGGQNFVEDNFFESLMPGNTYDVMILDQNGCDLMEEFSVPVVDSLVVEALDDEIEIFIGDDASLNVTTNWPEDEIASITWTPSTGLSCDNCLNPVTTNTSSVTYTVTVVNDEGCVDEAQIVLKVDRNINVYVPNVFSPHNDDGINDVFMIFARENTVVNVESFQVYDRWGEKVFVDANFLPNDEAHGWNGEFKGENAQPQVFVYYAVLELIDGTKLLLEGDVTLMN